MKKISGLLFEKLKADYLKTGYILVRNFFSPHEMTNLRQFAGEVAHWPETTGKWLKYFEILDNGHTVLSRVENFVRYHEGFSQLVDNKELLSLLSALMEEPVMFFKEKLNVKAPGAKGYTPHQDAPAFFDIDYDAITLLLAIDKATIENGCLYFEGGSNQFAKKILEQNEPNHALSKSVVDTICWVPIEFNPGDVIIFSSYAPHYSTNNNSSFERKALFLTFGKQTKSQNKTKEYFDKKRKLFPQDCEKISGVDYTHAATIYSFSSPVIVNPKADHKKTVMKNNQ